MTPVRDLITNVTVLHRQLNTPIPQVPNLTAKHGDELFGINKFIGLQVFPPAMRLRRASNFRSVVSAYIMNRVD